MPDDRPPVSGSAEVQRKLLDAGFRWDAEADYWTFDFGGGYSLTLEPLFADAGDYAMAVYNGRRLLLGEKVLVDVRLRAEAAA